MERILRSKLRKVGNVFRFMPYSANRTPKTVRVILEMESEQPVLERERPKLQRLESEQAEIIRKDSTKVSVSKRANEAKKEK